VNRFKEWMRRMVTWRRFREETPDTLDRVRQDVHEVQARSEAVHESLQRRLERNHWAETLEQLWASGRRKV
jgi:hypothetical protein